MFCRPVRKAFRLRGRDTCSLILCRPQKSAAAAGKAEVDVKVRYKQRLMAAVYKVYGDTEAGEGAYWVAKTIFKNTRTNDHSRPEDLLQAGRLYRDECA